MTRWSHPADWRSLPGLAFVFLYFDEIGAFLGFAGYALFNLDCWRFYPCGACHRLQFERLICAYTWRLVFLLFCL